MSSSPRKRNRNKRNRMSGVARTFVKRNQRLRSLGYATYDAYLASGAWKQCRESYYSRHDRRCAVCENNEDVSLHHCSYRRVGGQELDRDLVPLCDLCHRIAHSCRDTFGRQLVAQMREAFVRTGSADVALRERQLTIRSTARAGRKAPVRISFIENKETK